MAITFEVALSSYLDHLRIERSLSSASIEGYRRDLHRFDALLQDFKVSFTNLSEDKFGEVIATLSSAGLSTPSINRFTSAIKGFYKYCAIEYQMANPLIDIKSFKVARKLPKAISIEEVEKLLRATSSSSTATSLRDRLIIELLYGTGARVAELVGIDISDITKETLDGEEVTILKLRGKGSKERLVPIGKFAVIALDDKIHFQLSRANVEQLGPDPGPAPSPPVFRLHVGGQFAGERHETPPSILAEFFDRESPKLEARREQQPALQGRNLDHVTGVEAREARVLFPPEGRDRRGADLGVPVHGHRKVNAEKRVSQVGHRIDVGTKVPAGIVAIEVETLEGKNAVLLRESILPGDPVGVQTGRVDDVARPPCRPR